MPSWKKLIQSGSDAHLSNVTASALRVSSIQFDDGTIQGAAELGGAPNLFQTISSSGVSASGSFTANSATDTLTFEAGDNIFITASNNSVIISSSGGGTTTFNGNRRFLQTSNLQDLFNNNFNPGTSGSIEEFLEAVFYPNTAPSLSGSSPTEFTLGEFFTSGSTVGTLIMQDLEALDTERSFSTQSSYTDDFFRIHSGSGVITVNTETSASFNTTSGHSAGGLSHPFLVELSDSITTTNITVPIKITPNTAPIFRTTGTDGTQILSQTASINENTGKNGTEDILTFFITDTESDTITVSALSQSTSEPFQISVSSAGGTSKQVILQSNQDLYDRSSSSQYKLFISASDEHFGNSVSSSQYITTLPIEINITDNVAPTMAAQSFTLAEDSGSHDNNTGASYGNPTINLGTVTTNDTEGDNVTFTALHRVNPTAFGGTNQSDPHDNPFAINSLGALTLSPNKFLNADKINQYEYSASYKDLYNDASSSGLITINITPDEYPTISATNFYIIESATNGSSIRQGSNGRTGAQSRFTSTDNTVSWSIEPGNLLAVNSSGYVSLNFDMSGSIYSASASPINGHISASNAFGTVSTSSFSVVITQNNSPDISFSNFTSNLNTNSARGSENLVNISFSDDESDDIELTTFSMSENPSHAGQLTSATVSSNKRVKVNGSNLSAGTYGITASIQDEHGFRTTTEKHEFTIVQSPLGTMGTNGTFRIIESALSSSAITTNSTGIAGTSASLSVTYSPQHDSAAVRGFSIFNSNTTDAHSFLTSSTDDLGKITLKANISESIYVSGTTLSASVHYIDQYDNVGSSSINVSVRANTSPSITFTPDPISIASEDTVSGSLLFTASFSDTEGDTINFDSIKFSGTDITSSFVVERIGSENKVAVTTNTDISASTYPFTMSIEDIHGFSDTSASADMSINAMMYLYKHSVAVNGMQNQTLAEQILGITATDNVFVSESILAHFQSGFVGSTSFVAKDGAGYGVSGDVILVSSQSSNFVINNPVSNTLKQLTSGDNGRLNLSGNSNQGHGWLMIFPSSSHIIDLPSSTADINSPGNTTVGEVVAFKDQGGTNADAVESIELVYFSSSDANHSVRGQNSFGVIFSEGGSAGEEITYTLAPASQSSFGSDF